MRYELARIRPPLAHGRNGGQTQDRIRLGLMTSACLWFHGNFPEEIDGERNCSHCARRERKIRSDLMFVAAGAWWLVSEANQRNDSRGTSLLSYPAVLNSYPFPVIHPRAKEGRHGRNVGNGATRCQRRPRSDDKTGRRLTHQSAQHRPDKTRGETREVPSAPPVHETTALRMLGLRL